MRASRKGAHEFLWRSIRNAFKVGDFWSRFGNRRQRGIRSRCEIEGGRCTTSSQGRGVCTLANEPRKKKSTTNLPWGTVSYETPIRITIGVTRALTHFSG